jgi:hypothetical protein
MGLTGFCRGMRRDQAGQVSVLIINIAVLKNEYGYIDSE